VIYFEKQNGCKGCMFCKYSHLSAVVFEHGPCQTITMNKKSKKNNGNICFTCISNLTSAAHLTFETVVRYHGNTPTRFMTLLQRSKLQTPLYTILQKKCNYYKEMQGMHNDEIEFIWVMSFEICF